MVATGIEEKSDSDEYSIHPNPSNDYFSLENMKNVKSIKVFNIYGQEVFFLNEPATDKVVFGSDLARGNYMVVIESDSERRGIYRVAKNQ